MGGAADLGGGMKNRVADYERNIKIIHQIRIARLKSLLADIGLEYEFGDSGLVVESKGGRALPPPVKPSTPKRKGKKPKAVKPRKARK